MQDKIIGIMITDNTAPQVLRAVEEAERIGIGAAWLISGGVAMDPLTLLSAAATHTKIIKLGTAIVPFWPRHPLAIAQQVMAVAQLAPGRIRLGIGPSSASFVERTYGLAYQAPVSHMREYLRILRALLQKGSVDIDGHYYRAHAKITDPFDVPVMISALRRGSFELCGTDADGAITYICPAPYLREVAVPAIRAAAERAGRPAPQLVAGAVICIHDNLEEVRAVVRKEMGFYLRSPHYGQMFVDAGFSEASEGTWSDRMVDAVVFCGSETQVTDRLQELFSAGANELWIHVIGSGKDQPGSIKRTLEFVGHFARSIKS